MWIVTQIKAKTIQALCFSFNFIEILGLPFLLNKFTDGLGYRHASRISSSCSFADCKVSISSSRNVLFTIASWWKKFQTKHWWKMINWKKFVTSSFSLASSTLRFLKFLWNLKITARLTSMLLVRTQVNSSSFFASSFWKKMHVIVLGNNLKRIRGKTKSNEVLGKIHQNRTIWELKSSNFDWA